MNPSLRRFGVCALGVLLLSCAGGASDDGVKKREAAALEKLAAITAVDHSTIFLSGPNNLWYLREGRVKEIELEKSIPGSDCSGVGASHDGLRIIYAASAETKDVCRILVREISSGNDKSVVVIKAPVNILAWSWDDQGVLYSGAHAIYRLT